MSKQNHQDIPTEIERKFFIRKPDIAFLRTIPGCQATEIIQTYLLIREDGFNRRVRKRGNLQQWEYTYTRKKRIGFGERIELEDEITEKEYLDLLTEADPDYHPIHKIRCCIPYEGQLLEIDLYSFSSEYATLEIELTDIHTPVILPDWLEILADVTDTPGYSNFALSRTLKFPEVNADG